MSLHNLDRQIKDLVNFMNIVDVFTLFTAIRILTRSSWAASINDNTSEEEIQCI